MAPASDSTSNEGVATEGDHAPHPKGSPPPYDHALYANYSSTSSLLQQGSGGACPDLQIASFTNPTPATTSASYVGTTSFTNTFLRGILTSIDSKDPVVANAWLDTLLDAIDLLPPDVIKREIVAIAVSKGQLTNTVATMEEERLRREGQQEQETADRPAVVHGSTTTEWVLIRPCPLEIAALI